VILVVDDDADVREWMVDALTLRGHSVHAAGCGADALAQVWDFREIDTLVTDVNMPGMSGLDLVMEARKLRTSLAVIFVSGGPADAVFDSVFLEGLGALALRKPFRIAELEEAIENARRRE